MTPLDILGRYWGYDAFRECQQEIIGSVLAGRDTIGLLPTGGGKSVTFQVPALMLPGITVVVTPLISLMKDQVDNLLARGIRAVCIHSGQSRPERHLALDRLRQGMAKILYISPERAVTPEFIDELQSWDPALLVVDEAHCISQWGYDFRPPYLRLALLRRRFPDIPVLALTASATPGVVSDIALRLEMRSPQVFSRSFARDNISYIVRYGDSKDNTLLRVLAGTSGSAIVYVRSRERTARLAEMIREAGFSADFYHAGLEPHDKTERQDLWKSGRTRVIVATNAFGMGIDKPDVRTVIHYDLPPSLEEYYQEAGRAGRDGLPSFAVMLVGSRDKALMTRRLNDEFPGREYIAAVYEKLCVFLNISVGAGYMQAYDCDFDKFCKTFRLQPRPALAALRILTRAGLIDYHDDLDGRSRVMIVADKRELYYADLGTDGDMVLQDIMRCYPGLFADFVRIDEDSVCSHLHISREQCYQALLYLSRTHIIQYIPRRELPFVLMPQRRIETRHILIPRTVYEDRLAQARRRMEAMRDYAYDSSECRVRRMLEYFGQNDAADCGKCDVCRARDKKSKEKDYDRIVADLIRSWGGRLTMDEVREVFPGERLRPAVAALRAMMDRGEVLRYPDGTFRLKL